MKYVYILIVIALIGGIFLYTNKEEVAVEEQPPVTEEPNAEIEEEMEETPEPEPSDEEASTETGTDAGMELSTIEEESDEIVFEVRGSNFIFDVTEMRVKEGDTVTVNFESIEGFHDWVVDEFDAATAQVRPGSPTSVTFVADTVGTYEYYCSVGSHRERGMVGTLIVEPAE